MENKLELKHLAPYLPYGVQGKYNLKDVEAHYPDRVNDKGLRADNVDFFLKYCKPLFIPLSELTEEQWIEVFKAGRPSLTVCGIKTKNAFIKVFYNQLDAIIYYFDDNQFYGNGDFNQLAAFNKLFELHADVYGLIEAKLALNKLEHGK